MKVFGIVVAAGTGERFGRRKADVELAGRPLWQWGSDALRAGGCEVVVVVGDVPGGVPGGARRRDSVAAGLMRCGDASHVLVHDAARPLASPDLARRVIDRLRSGATAVIPAVPVRDTLKRADDGRVVGTVARDGLVAVQTPQGFSLEALRSAHEADLDDATDDAQLIERIGGEVVVIDGEEHNLKITYPGDLAIAEAIAP